ncbi:MAG: aminofutalosine synthase MqnE [Planctomycetes bacterium]|nr:aminofutalosine synthase MqnE [Planctomycetota bacterium]
MHDDSTPTIASVREKLEAGQRLSFADGVFLFGPQVSLHELGALAELRRRALNGNWAYYNINAHLNPTNVCVYRCVFCAFRSDLRGGRAYLMDGDQIRARGQEAVDHGCTEMHIVGGLHHEKKFDWYVNILRMLHESFPQLHLKAWTAVEISWFEQLTGKSVRGVLEELVAAGLGSLPGGGAEIFHRDVRDRLCEHKADAAKWLDIHRTAHEMGLRSNCTMLYGHIETDHHRVDHLLRLRALQDETGGFQTFVPLAFHPENTGLAHLRAPSAPVDLRTIAVSRLLLDNIPHIKAYWVMLGVGTAQLALAYGADDLDGTVRHELIGHDAGATSPTALSVDEIRRLILDTGREPVERDTLYRHVVRDSDQQARWHAGAPIACGG